MASPRLMPLVALATVALGVGGCGSSPSPDSQPDTGMKGATAAPPGSLSPPADLPTGAMKKGGAKAPN